MISDFYHHHIYPVPLKHSSAYPRTSYSNTSQILRLLLSKYSPISRADKNSDECRSARPGTSCFRDGLIRYVIRLCSASPIRLLLRIYNLYMYRTRIGIRVHRTGEVGTRNRRNRSQRNPFRLSATCRISACLASCTRLL